MQVKGSTYAIFDTHHLATFFHKQQARGGSRGSLHLLGTSFEPSFFFFFANDSLLFCRATSRDWERLAQILECYEKASGQQLNKEKTSIFFSHNTSQEARDCILRLSGVPSTQRYDQYMGLPALVGKSQMKEFKSIKDKVEVAT
jgi:hypothetical protein